MKSLTKNVSRRDAMPPTTKPALAARATQLHAAGHPTCRTATCAVVNHRTRSGAPDRRVQDLNQSRGIITTKSMNQGQQSPARRPPTLGSKAPNYKVHTPIPLGRGSQQIRATIQGTPQVAGSVEISAAGPGKAYISNLKVDQQHRRRGVAAKLIDAAVSAARRQGFRAASLEARPSDNGISPQALVAMYRRQGFRSVGKSFRGSPLMERRL